MSAIQRQSFVIRADNQFSRPRLGAGAFHNIRTANQPVEFVACVNDPEEVRRPAHDREVTDERSVMFVGVDGGEVEEPLVEPLEIIPLDLDRMVKYWLDEAIDCFGYEAEVQSRIPPFRRRLDNGDDRLGWKGGKGVAVVGHWKVVSERSNQPLFPKYATTGHHMPPVLTDCGIGHMILWTLILLDGHIPGCVAQ